MFGRLVVAAQNPTTQPRLLPLAPAPRTLTLEDPHLVRLVVEDIEDLSRKVRRLITQALESRILRLRA